MPSLTVSQLAAQWSLATGKLLHKLKQLGFSVADEHSVLDEEQQDDALERLWLWHKPTAAQTDETTAWIEAQLEVPSRPVAPGYVPLGGDYWQGTHPVEANSPGASSGRAPVWGIADTHAHIVSHCGFGGLTIAGKAHAEANTPLQSMADALDPCDDFHDVLYNVDFVHQPDGYPTFDGWPKFTTRGHQQSYVTWLRRAYEGGLRLVCCLAVNGEKLAQVMSEIRDGRGNDDDREAIVDEWSIYAQVKEIKSLVDYVNDACNGDGWLRIVEDPQQARDAIEANKLAVVLGVEVDDLGGWTKGESMVDGPLPDEPEAGRHKIRTLLQRYYNWGIRQFTPIHLADNVFGGCAIYNKAFELLQSDVNKHERYSTRYHDDVANGWEHNIRYRLDQDGGLMTNGLLALTFPPPNVLSGSRWTPQDGADWGHMNGRGLTDYGKILLEELAHFGMVVDLDHMAHKTTEEALAHIKRFRTPTGDIFPVLSSHTGLRDLALTADVPFEGQDHRQKYGKYGTKNVHEVANESQKTAEQIGAIREQGGMIAPILLQSVVNDADQEHVANDCPRSSKSWAQAFLYAIDKMGHRNVALGSDLNGMVEFPGPRFGPFVAYGLLRAYKAKEKRKESAEAQSNGVHYKGLLRGIREARFAHDKVFSKIEREAWQAIAFLASGLSLPFHADQLSRDCADFVRGFKADTLDNDANQPQQAAYYVAHATREQLIGMRDGLDDALPPQTPARVVKLARMLAGIWLKWGDMLGDNVPLERCYAGWQRDFDYNIDGFAHYGLLPDFLQDLKNVGLQEEHMKVLFRSAEDYIQLWERSWAFKDRELRLNDPDS